ncbi:MAG: ABC transporter ATP-binding protein, partial [Zestosphaera sp.]
MSARSTDAIMRLEDVWKAYRVGDIVTWALRGVNLSVERGDFISIMGPSGSGKTTLLNILGLLDRPTRGRVYIDGVEVSGLKSDELARLRNRKIGFVFQQFNLIARMTVYENIELSLVPARVSTSRRREMILRALKSVGGEEGWLVKKPTQLSGGQQQRVAIARALVNNPEIILADEPTGNLDRASAKVVLETFLKLNRGGQTIIVVTHDPEVANCTNKIHLIRDGVIVETKKSERSL